jgi:hypothetical protein
MLADSQRAAAHAQALPSAAPATTSVSQCRFK